MIRRARIARGLVNDRRPPRWQMIARLRTWIRSWFTSPTVPPVLGHVVFVTDAATIAHVSARHALMVTRIEREAPHLVVHRTWGGRLGYYDYDHFPPPNRGARATWWQGDRSVVGLGHGPIADDTLDHELAHDVIDDTQHPWPIFDAQRRLRV